MAARPSQAHTVGDLLVSLGPGAGTGLAVRAALVVLLLAAASAAWWVARRRAAWFRPLHARRAADVSTLTSADLPGGLGARGTFVQFSSATCNACPQVNRVLGELAATEPGVVHVDLASEEHLGLVRRFSVYRTPTVLLLDADGAVRSRTSGPLTPARALAALHQLTHDSPRSIDA